MVALAGVFLLGLGFAGFFAPATARRFLLAFVGSSTSHFVEMFLRMLAGGAFVLHAPASRAPDIFLGIGWILVATTAVLTLIPWRWHRMFSQRSVPQALRYLPFLAGSSIVMGAGVLYLAFAGAGQA